MEIRQMYNVPKIVGMFEKSWGQQFDPSSRESCACLFEECVFGHHISPQHATAIVEEAKHLIFVTTFDADGTVIKREMSYPKTITLGELGSEHRTVLRTQPKGSGLHIGHRPGQYALACD